MINLNIIHKNKYSTKNESKFFSLKFKVKKNNIKNIYVHDYKIIIDESNKI